MASVAPEEVMQALKRLQTSEPFLDPKVAWNGAQSAFGPLWGIVTHFPTYQTVLTEAKKRYHRYDKYSTEYEVNWSVGMVKVE